MAATAERMKAMRARRRQESMRDLRLIVPDARTAAIRRRVALQLAGLSPVAEQEALDWIQLVSEFDETR